MLNGAEYVVEAVATSPNFDVCVANKRRRVSGSNSQHLAWVLIRYESETVPDEQEVELSSFARVCDRLEIESLLLGAAPGTRQPDT